MTPETAQALEMERKWRKRAEDRDEQGWVTLVNCANELRDKLATLRAQLAGRDGEAVDGWPEYVLLRDTKLHDDMGGLGQRIFTTAGAGYEKRKYVRADLAYPAPAVVSDEMVERFCLDYWDGSWPAKPDTAANREVDNTLRKAVRRALTAALTEGGSRE